jgi:hypothetical protein
MATVTFDGLNKEIIIGYDGPITEITAVEIYSRWKEWVAEGNAQYLPAFGESVGGNELGGGTALAGYFFVRNDFGWAITHSEFDYEIRISGDLYPVDTSIPWLAAHPADSYSVQFVLQRSAASYVSTAPGSTIAEEDKSDIVGRVASHIWAAS